MDSDEVRQVCSDRFAKWQERLVRDHAFPICVVGMPLNDPLSGMKVYALGHTQRHTLRIFFESAVRACEGENDFSFIGDDTEDESDLCTS